MPTKAFLYGEGEVVRFYRWQLRKFNKLGIGALTENGVKVTQKLIDVTQKRLEQLSVSALKRRSYGI